MLAELATVPEEVELDKASSYFIEARKYLAKLRHSNNHRKDMTEKTAASFQDFTIGDVMQISPITLQEIEQKLSSREDLTLVNKLNKAMYISICFFVMATESRLMAGDKHKVESLKKTSS